MASCCSCVSPRGEISGWLSSVAEEAASSAAGSANTECGTGAEGECTGEGVSTPSEKLASEAMDSRSRSLMEAS